MGGYGKLDEILNLLRPLWINSVEVTSVQSRNPVVEKIASFSTRKASLRKNLEKELVKSIFLDHPS